jgi:hypothetical protein
MLPLFFWEFLPVSINNKHNTQEFLVRSKRTKNLYKEPVTRREIGLPNQNTVTEPSNKNKFKPPSKKLQKR